MEKAPFASTFDGIGTEAAVQAVLFLAALSILSSLRSPDA